MRAECMAYLRRQILFAAGMLLMTLMLPVRAEAGSARIQFTTASAEVQKGELFTVVCQVTSPDAFLDTEFQIQYDDELVRFLDGGGKITGGSGLLTVSSTGNETSTEKKTFSLQFVAEKKGKAVIDLKGTASVQGEDGTSFSSSSNRLVVTIKKKGASPEKTPVPKMPAVTPEPVLSGNNKLKSLKLDARDFTPEFSSDREEYNAVVDHKSDILYMSFQTEDEKARVRCKGNEKLKEGKNEVQLIVTAENGSVKTYRIHVTRETEGETRERELQDSGVDADISFEVKRDKDRILLKNSYEFQVLDPAALKEIPAGYVLSGIEINGIRVPAYTMENDLDNNYLLMYLKGPTGTAGIYQYDRTEKTLQRYTGTMIDKVNKSAGVQKKESALSVSNYVLLGIIIGLVVIILCMLITMLKMAMKRKEEAKNQKSEDYHEEKFYR